MRLITEKGSMSALIEPSVSTPGQGFEPQFSDPESDVLPLHHPGKSLLTPIRANSMAVCANEIALCHLIEEAFHAQRIDQHRHLSRFLFAFSVIEIHHIKRENASAIGARARLALP